MLSYNSTGLSSDSILFIRELLDRQKPDILFLQETWRVQSTLHKIGDIHKGYLWHGVCGVNECERILPGRPPGGVAILWKKSLAEAISKVKPKEDHKRICGIVMNCDYFQMLLMNVYMPNDNYSKSHVDDDFSSACEQMECMYREQNTTYCVLGGDFNVDFRRGNAHDKWMDTCLCNNGLVNTWDLPGVVPEDTYVTPDFNAKSRIDYLCCSANLEQNVSDVVVHKVATNNSWHRPVSMVIRVEHEVMETATADMTGEKPVASVAWHKVTENHIGHYQRHVTRLLQWIQLPGAVFCQDLTCDNPEHRDQITAMCDAMSMSCLNAANMCLPKRKKKKRNKPGWPQSVQPYKEASIAAHNIWTELGEPEEGEDFENMKEAKRQFSYACRRMKRQERYTRNEKMADAIVYNRSRDMWKEVDRVNGGRTDPPNLDGIRDPKKVADHLKSKYKGLLNSNPPQQENIKKIQDFISSNIESSDIKDFLVFEEDVTKAISMLKHGKSDGDKGVLSDHIIHGPKYLSTLIALLITTARKHGHMPDDMLLASIASIPKDKCGNACSSDNYRGISLCSAMSKINDIIILQRYENLLVTSDMQYSFKKHHGTTMCTLVVKEVAKYYLRQGSEVLSCSIDASKAFDKVRHDKLFLLLVERGLPAVIIRSLFDSYRRQKMRAMWGGHKSDPFETSNGIKQGSIISPVLFIIYMDALLKRLEKSGIGCHIGKHYYGATGYADDLKLLCPTGYGLQQMIRVCEEFGDEYGVTYNPQKSMCMCITHRREALLPNLTLAGQQVKWVEREKHLGNILKSDLRESDEITRKKGDLIGRVNNILVTFPMAPDNVTCELFNSKCSHLYGCEAWDLGDPNVDQFYKSWNRSVRRLYKLPYDTHTRFLSEFVQAPHVMDQVLKRSFKLIRTMAKAQNVRLSFLTRLMMEDSRSIIGKNIRIIARHYNIRLEDVKAGDKYFRFRSKLCDNDLQTVTMIKELRQILNGKATLGGFNNDEIFAIFSSLCSE